MCPFTECITFVLPNAGQAACPEVKSVTPLLFGFPLSQAARTCNGQPGSSHKTCSRFAPATFAGPSHLAIAGPCSWLVPLQTGKDRAPSHFRAAAGPISSRRRGLQKKGKGPSARRMLCRREGEARSLLQNNI